MISLHGSTMWYLLYCVVIVFSVVSSTRSEAVNACDAGCTCSLIRPKSDDDSSASDGRKIVCNGKTLQLNTSTLQNITFPNDTMQLDLSKNGLTFLDAGVFTGLPVLVKLDLSDNSISTIEDGAFEDLSTLQRLDLSNNHLTAVNSSMFHGLTSVTKLSLSGNQLTTLEENAFANMTLLKKIDFASDVLNCDCRLQWLVKWTKVTGVRISQSTQCVYPHGLLDTPLRSLKRKDLHCEWPLEWPLFELTPSSNQIVFQGDRLPFECRASISDTDATMMWVRDGLILANHSDARVLMSQSESRDITVNTMVIESLETGDSGVWECLILTPDGNVSKTVNIVVISDDTVYCPEVVTQNDRGTFRWPKTVTGIVMDLPCPHGGIADIQAPSQGSKDPGVTLSRGYYQCNSSGAWEQLNTTLCHYEREVTRVLQQYCMIEKRNHTHLASRAEHFKVYIYDAISRTSITETQDIIFVSCIVENLGQQVINKENLSDVILNIVSMMMNLNLDLLIAAQIQDQALTRMIRTVEDLPRQLKTSKASNVVSKHAQNIALHAFEVHPHSFQGVTCATYVSKKDQSERSTAKKGMAMEWSFNDKSFFCAVQSNATALQHQAIKDKIFVGAIHVPSSTFDNVECRYPVCSSSHSFKLQFIAYKNAKLFPVLKPNVTQAISRQTGNSQMQYVLDPGQFISTSVLSSNIAGVEVNNLTSPVVLTLYNQQQARKGSRPVYWDFLAQDGFGAWSDRGCKLTNQTTNTTTIKCTHMTNYAVIQPSISIPLLSPSWYNHFLATHPAVYSGSAILVICCLAVIVTYVTSSRFLKMSDKAKHSVGNLCLCLLLLALTFSLGVYQTEVDIACQVIGVALHYLSLSAMFWFLVTAYNLYKKLKKNEESCAMPVSTADGIESVPAAPMLRFYLIGWGISIIICGISGAISMEYYIENDNYCFLATWPSVGVFFVPVGAALFLTLSFLLCVFNVIRRPSDPSLVDHQETEDIIDGQHIDGQQITPPGISSPNMSPGSSLDDLEYHPLNQLRALAFILLLFLCTWICGAFSVALPFPDIIPYQYTIFVYLYAACSSLLGLVILIFFCLGREDARALWRKFFSCQSGQPAYALSTSASNKHIHHHTHDHSNNKHATITQNNGISRAATITDGSFTTSVQDQRYPSFYNEQQNGCARRYWEKKSSQKHQQKLLSPDRSNIEANMSNAPSLLTQGSRPVATGQSSSDTAGQTHLNIQIQIQNHNQIGNGHLSSNHSGSNHVGTRPGVVHHGSNHLSSTHTRSSSPHSNHTYDSLHYRPTLANGQPILSVHQLDHTTQLSNGSLPGSGVSTNPGTYRPLCVAHGGSDYPALPPPPPHRPHQYAIDNYIARTANTFSPPASLVNGPRLVNHKDYIINNGSVPRLCDYDGYSSPGGSNGPSVRHSKPHPLPRPNQQVLNQSGASDSSNAMKSSEGTLTVGGQRSNNGSANVSNNASANMNDSSHDSPHDSDCQVEPESTTAVESTDDPMTSDNFARTSQSDSSENHDSFMNRLEQRIPPTNQPSSSNHTINRSTELKPNPSHGGRHRKHHHHHHHHHHRKRNHKPKPRHKRWEQQNSQKLSANQVAKKPAYAFVNHSYQDKVLQRLIQQAPSTNDSLMSWFPRSVSAYEQVANDVFDESSTLSDSSSDSSDDGEQIWVMQQEKARVKKETSV